MVGFTELDFHARDEQKRVRDGIAGEGQGLSEQDESRINEDTEGAKFGPMQLVRSQAVPPILQQHPQGPQGSTVCWERFLPLRSLKVLLVENDDSTRHVVSALLRNCSYEVTAVANSLEAWKILEDLTNHIDLVLAEVVMPFLSGIALLCRIMNHKTCKNIPVIMMSSNDSMGIVFKCLSKGAVDFLVKPIRKNELKNLWQHVWRKCHSSSGSGSGSESGIRTQNSTRSKSIEESDNDTDSNDEDDNASIGLNFRDGSDNGSGTQSSWTKQAVEVESPRRMSPWSQLADPPDSTCAQVVHSRPEAFSNQVPTMSTKGYNRQDCMNGNDAIGKDLQREVPRSPDLQIEEQGMEVLVSVAEANEKKNSDSGSRKGDEKLERVKLEINGETPKGEFWAEAADFIGTVTNCSNPQMENVAQIPVDISITNGQVKAIYEAKELPSLELSLKRQRDIEENEPGARERNVLRRSNLSAFSRYYNTNSTANQASAGNVGSCSPGDNSSETAKTETMHNLQSNSNGTPNQGSNGSSNNNDMGSTTNNAYTRPPASGEEPMLKSAVNIHPCSAFQPVKDGYVSSLQSLIPDKINVATMNTVLAQAKGMPSHVQRSHNHQHYHHHHYHIHDMQQQRQKLPNLDELSGMTLVAATPQSGPFSFSSSKTEGGSASGSSNGSNGQNGSSSAIGDGTNRGSDNGVAEKRGAGSGGGSGSGGGVDQNGSARREAALKKFREKRKERCFKKKVRYQSRKTLAEQRPRVRGQFARQSHVR